MTSARRASTWDDIRSPAIAGTLGGAWSLGCFAVGAWLVQQYFAIRDTACPPAGDMAAFCRASLADALGANLGRVSQAFLVGLALTGMVVALLFVNGGSRCSSCGARRRLEAKVCGRCGFDSFV